MDNVVQLIAPRTSGWKSLMPFIDGSETYVLGFEAGKLWRLLEVGSAVNSYPDHELAHLKNVPQFELFAEHWKCDLFVDDCGDGCWCYVTFAPNPRRFA